MKEANDAHGRSIALMKFLSGVARGLGVAEHVYVVGGAVRNFILDQPIKDIDVVFDSVSVGKGRDSDWFAKEVAKAIPVRTNVTTNQYGVAILTVSDSWELDGYEMKGEVIEIANARKESYGKGEGPGKGYKPDTVEPATIEEDLVRREFTFNTLLWRLADLEHGPDKAEVLDMLGSGKADLESRTMRTPVDPDKTFSDDPTRMLRAIKFVAKYGFKIPSDMLASIQKNAPKLKNMPWNAVWTILVGDILEGPSPRKSVKLLHDLGLGHVIKEMFHETPDFASAVSRKLPDKEIHLILDLVDLGWAVKTPVSFLVRGDQMRLREILLENASEGGFDKDFVAALTKPPIDQPRLFDLFQIPPKERQAVSQIARNLLLRSPLLARTPKRLEEAVEEELRHRYPEAPLSPAKVAARFDGR
jgi:tRNA nucleotidyltransferase/poly(A) polymerase